MFSCFVQQCVPKVTFREFFWLRFRMASAFCFYLVLQRVLLFEAFGLVFCCSRLSGAVFQGQISRGPKDVFVDSKGNVKEFFGSGFGCFRLVSRWCLGLFASRAPRPERVLLFEAFGLVFCCSRLSEAVVQGQISRGRKDVFVDSKGNVKEFFGSSFGRFRLVSRWCLGLFASRPQGEISRGPKDCCCGFQR